MFLFYLSVPKLLCDLIGCRLFLSAAKDDESPKKPLGVLPPERPPPSSSLTAHIANGRMEAPPTPHADLEAPGELPGERKRSTPQRRHEGSVANEKPHAVANHTASTGTIGRSDLGPRWVKPSEGKLAAMMEGQTNPNGTNHRPRSRGPVPGANRGSNASQYDNMPTHDEDFADVANFERQPAHTMGHGSPNRPPSGGISAPTFRVPRIPPMPLVPAPYSTPPAHYPPSMSPAYPAYGEHPYATTARSTPSKRSPEKMLMNNSYATYRRQPSDADFSGRVDMVDDMGGGYFHRQPTRFLDQRYERQWRAEGWHGGEFDVGVLRSAPRSPSFQNAQLSPVHPGQDSGILPVPFDAMPHYRASGRNQMPTVFGGAHYRHEAFVMQESMIL